jgi:hypothetical protein
VQSLPARERGRQHLFPARRLRPCASAAAVNGSNFSVAMPRAAFCERERHTHLDVRCSVQPRAASKTGGKQRRCESKWRGSFFDDVSGVADNIRKSYDRRAVSSDRRYTTYENVLHNVCLTTTVTGRPDNTPLKITNTFWFFMDDGCLQAGSGTLPVALLTGEASIDGEAPLVGLAYFRG